MGFIIDLFSSGGIGTILGGITGLFGNWLKTRHGLLDIFRGLMRPGGTTYMMIMVSMIYWEYKGMMETYAIRPTPEQAHEVMMYLIGTFSYLMITSFVFWYGDRNKQQPPGQLNK
jgi:hypothetical protein